MPGREDLIQQNRAAVRSRVESADEQASTGGEKPVYSSHRSLLGGNLDVASALDSIQFASEGPLGDGALRNSVAYIRYWSRPGSKATAETSSQTVDATQIDPAADSQAQIQQQIRENYLLPKTLVDSSAADYLSDTYAFRDVRANERVGDSFTSGKLGTEVGIQGDVIPDTGADPNTGYRPSSSDSLYANGWDAQTIQVDSKPQKTRQDALSVKVPKINNEYTFSKTDLNTAKFDTSFNLNPEIKLESRTSGVGQLKPANPNGFVNTISKIGRSVLGLPPGQIGYQGAAGAAQGGKAPLASGGTLAKGMWQFLFNPSELEIDAGPEFKAAETWGVSDKANSGQPLNWSHNKNTQLKFNSVLLNGYVFGRKVEELEQGIFELFMAREGGGQAGPPILEFVWGKRVFGPCVIKDISVKEKMWDEGMVVNAELSFTLEQIPEWTINDGYVDIARPGKIPMVYDPTEENKDTPGNIPGATPPPPGSENPEGTPGGGQKGGGTADPSSTGSAYRTCQKAYEFKDVFQSIMYREGPLAKANYNGMNGILQGDIVLRKYTSAFNSAKSSVGINFTRRVPQQYLPASIAKSVSDMRTNGTEFNKQIDFITTAASKCREAILNVWNIDCKKLIEDGKKAQTAAANANQKQALCNGITVGKPCNIGPGNFSPKNPCTGKQLRCNARNIYEDI